MRAEEFIMLKAKVKTEMNRRCLAGLDEASIPTDFGSLRAYGGDTYDFGAIPSEDTLILTEQGEKVINVLYTVKDINNVLPAVKGEPLPSKEKIESLGDYLSALASEPIEGETSSCRGACSGLCFGSCIGGCNGCSGTCIGGCQGCTATCGTGCASGSMA